MCFWGIVGYLVKWFYSYEEMVVSAFISFMRNLF